MTDTSTGEVESVDCDGAFIAIGHRPNIAFLDGQVTLDDKGYVRSGPNNTMTSVPGVFACGKTLLNTPMYETINYITLLTDR